jgi:MFS transporter, DHA2 family, methylenomycin A resistance protein
MFRQMGGSLGASAADAVVAVQTTFITGLRVSLVAIAVLGLITTPRQPHPPTRSAPV